MLISVTERHLFRSCRRMWHYYKVQKFVPRNEAPHFWFGSGIHWALKNYYSTPQRGIEHLLAGWDQWVTENPREGEAFEALYELAPNMLETYWHYEKYQTPWEVIEAENRVTIPILHPETRNPVEGGELTGQIDLKIRLEGKLYIVDHKTTRQIQTNYAGLDVDDQVTGYAYIHWRQTGELPDGIIYNVLGKNSRGWPNILKDGTISRNKNQGTTYGRYMTEILRLGFNPRDYADVLSTLLVRPEVSRMTTTRNIHELMAYERNLFIEHEEMCRLAGDFKKAYPSPSTWNCNWCSYLPPCKAEQDGGDPDFILKFGYKKEESIGNQATSDELAPEY